MANKIVVNRDSFNTLVNDNAALSGAAFTGDVTVAGNLTVSGTTTTVINLDICDNIIGLNNGLTGASSNDSGFIIERGSTGDNAFMGWDESEDKFIVGTTTATASSLGDLTITTGTLVANLEGDVSGNVTGNVTGSSGTCTGNAATATKIASITNTDIVLLEATQELTNKTLVAPALGTPVSGNLSNCTFPTLNQDTSGNAATATTLSGLNVTVAELNTIIADSAGLTGAAFTGDVSVAGNLTVSGTTSTVINLDISDNLIGLNNGLTNGAESINDAGIIIARGNTGANAFMGWDESVDKFTVGLTTATASSLGDLTITPGTLVANLEGDVSGNASTASTATTLNGLTATVAELNTYVLNVALDNISTASSCFVVAPKAGTISKITSIIDGTINGGDAVITAKVNGGTSIEPALTIAFTGSAVADIDTIIPTLNNDITAGQYIQLTTNAESSGHVKAVFTIEITY
jgi:trimeric autotransporter adhesin